MDINKLKVGQPYWVIKNDYTTNTSFIFSRTSNITGETVIHYGEQEYNLLKYCILQKIDKKYNNKKYDFLNIKSIVVDKSYYFYYPTKKYGFEFDWFEVTNSVFKEKDDYLVFLVKAEMNMKKRNNNTRIKFDDFFKEKIKESQEKNPEKWIF